MKRTNLLLGTLILGIALISCKKDDENVIPPNLMVKIRFDSSLDRLDNFGQPVGVGADNAAQSPVAHSFSAHYIELAPNAYTQLQDGEVIFVGEETTAGGAQAVDWQKAKVVGNDDLFAAIPLSAITPGTYEWIRVSLTYQNGDITVRESGQNYTGRLASFVGYNTYITSHTVNTQTLNVNGNRAQGYWAFETFGIVVDGQAPGTTVPNPLASTSPIPPGSCVVTGEFPTPLTITGEETEDITLYLNFSTNNSFEWYDANSPDGLYEPSAGDTAVDMGLRGLFPTYEK